MTSSLKCVKKYKVDPDQAVLKPATSSRNAVKEEEGDVPELSGTEYAIHVQAIYEQYNPKKLADMGRLLQKYRRRERELFVEVCKKYGVKPANYSREATSRAVKGEL